jgi:hypothetical protein
MLEIRYGHIRSPDFIMHYRKNDLFISLHLQKDVEETHFLQQSRLSGIEHRRSR